MTRALIISGGGSKGAWAVGVLDHLVNTKQLAFDIVAGTSTGALMAPLALLGDVATLKHLYTTVTTPDILTERNVLDSILNYPSIYDSTPLWHLLNDTVTQARFDAVVQSGKQLLIAAINLRSGGVVYFHTKADPRLGNVDGTAVHVQTRDELACAIMASANEPVFTQPVDVRVAAAPGGQYTDGGVRNVLPVEPALLLGADEVYTIALSAEKDEDPSRFDSVVPILVRTINIFCMEIAHKDLLVARWTNDAVRHRDAVKQALMQRFNLTAPEADALFDVPGVNDPFKTSRTRTLVEIRPESSLEAEFGITGLQFEPEAMKKMMAAGLARAQALVP